MVDRSGWPVGFALALGACFAPSAPVGAPCTDACPGGQVCEAGRCRAPGDRLDAPPVVGPDADGDGVRDDDDNCPARANDQHDEDGDLVGDACDGCPHVADRGQDADADGVGDACDPHPAKPGDRIARFEAFAQPTAGWTLGAAWRYADDQLIVDAGAVGEIAELAQPTGRSVIEIGGRVAWAPRTAPGMTARQLALQFGRSGGSYHYCELFEDVAGANAALIAAAGGLYLPLAEVPLPDGLVDGRFAIAVTADATSRSATCRIGLAGRQDTVGTTATSLLRGELIAIYALRATVAIDYLVQIETP